MKIAIIIPHFYPYVGGGEKMFYDLAKGLVKEGHEVRVVARNVGDEYLGYRRVNGLDIWYCDWISAFGHPIPRRRDIEEHICWCDVVHTSIFTTAPVVSRMARHYKKGSLLTVYEVRGNKWFWTDVFYRAVIYWMVEQFSCRQRFDCYHAISEATKRDYLKYIGKREVRRVYLANEIGKEEQQESSFSLREYFGLKDETVFLYYGRPGRTKGVELYRDAIGLLKSHGMDFKNAKFCFILGKEPVKLRAAFVRSIERKGLSDLILVRDSLPREELAEAIRQADCVVVPSITEGFGFSALEAAQSGTPLISSNGGSLPEVVYGHCRFFQNRNARELARCLEGFIRKGTDSMKQVPEKEFTYAEMLGGIEELYREIKDKEGIC